MLHHAGEKGERAIWPTYHIRLRYFVTVRAVHQAYLPIVAASTRASTLHYCCNDREFAWGPVNSHDHHNVDELAHSGDRQLLPQVLLIDAGCEWNCYASDITRTMPVGNGGKFTPEARAIYELVLEMQKVRIYALVVIDHALPLILGIIRYRSRWSALGRSTADLPSHAHPRIPKPRDLQDP